MFGLFGGETRSSTTSVGASSASDWYSFYNQPTTAAAINVTEDVALGVPAIWCAVNVIAGTIAHLPLHLYKITDGKTEKALTDPLYNVVHDYATDYHTKFDFWKLITTRALIGGRGIAIILRNKAKRAAGFLPIDERQVTIRQSVKNGVVTRIYSYNGTDYPGTDIIDISPMLMPDGISAYSPVVVNREAIAAIVAADRYGTSMFANGGVPPLALKMPPSSPAAADRAVEQVSEAIQNGKDRKRNMFALPNSLEIEPLGFEPAKQQLVELRKLQVAEVARIFNIAPALLHDLTTGTYSNVEQQALNFVSQTILPLVKLIEQELNLKLFGKRNTSNFVEFNIDALVRGDLKSRMEALVRSVFGSIRTPNEARALDNLPPLPGGDQLYIQGATVPLEDAGKTLSPTPVPTTAQEDQTNVKDNNGNS